MCSCVRVDVSEDETLSSYILSIMCSCVRVDVSEDETILHPEYYQDVRLCSCRCE